MLTIKTSIYKQQLSHKFTYLLLNLNIVDVNLSHICHITVLIQGTS